MVWGETMDVRHVTHMPQGIGWWMRLHRACVGLVCAIASTLAWAEPLPTPSGRVILSVEGAISHTNAGDRADFDAAMLEALPSRGITTSTPWTDGVTHFEGPLASAVLEVVGAHGRQLVITALNDYSVTVPVSDLEQYQVILAMRQGGERLRIRDKGPLFLIYPFDDYPRLNNEMIHTRSIWQIRRIRVD